NDSLHDLSFRMDLHGSAVSPEAPHPGCVHRRRGDAGGDPGKRRSADCPPAFPRSPPLSGSPLSTGQPGKARSLPPVKAPVSSAPETPRKDGRIPEFFRRFGLFLLRTNLPLQLADCASFHVIMGTEALPGKVRDRKSTRLNSSHVKISYAVFCLKKK